MPAGGIQPAQQVQTTTYSENGATGARKEIRRSQRLRLSF